MLCDLGYLVGFDGLDNLSQLEWSKERLKGMRVEQWKADVYASRIKALGVPNVNVIWCPNSHKTKDKKRI